MDAIDVTCAILVRNEKLLVCQRRAGTEQAFLWEFPGGKVEQGETYEQCIVREIMEELGVEMKIDKPLLSVEYHYPNRTIRLIPFLGHIPQGEPISLDHHAIEWIGIDQIDKLEWSDADKALIERNELKNSIKP
jgi:8-oxo-dGTP diphosphatase